MGSLLDIVPAEPVLLPPVVKTALPFVLVKKTAEATNATRFYKRLTALDDVTMNALVDLFDQMMDDYVQGVRGEQPAA